MLVATVAMGLVVSCATAGSTTASGPDATGENRGIVSESSPTELAKKYYAALSDVLKAGSPEAAVDLFSGKRSDAFRRMGVISWRGCIFTEVHEAQFVVEDGRDAIRTRVSFECPGAADTEVKLLFKEDNGYVLDEL